MSKYTTRSEAIGREIVAPLESTDEVTDAGQAFDVDAIANEVIGHHEATDAAGNVLLDESYFYCTVEAAEFWAIAQRHAK